VYGCDYRRGMDWWTDLLTIYTHHSELQVITAPPLISILYISPQHPLSFFPTSCVFISRSLATTSNSGDSSASKRLGPTKFLQPPVQNWTLNWQMTTNSSPRATYKTQFPVVCVFVAAETCLLIRCLETGWITPLFILLSHGHCLATAIHVII
jgi:hypothetical protein